MEKKRFLYYNLQFFAKEGAGGEKTEEPTAKKLSDARKEGQVARSNELITAASLITLFLVLKVFVGFMGDRFHRTFDVFYQLISKYATGEFNYQVASAIFKEILFDIVIIGLPVFIASFVVAILVNVAQVKWEVSAKPLQPKLDKLNPISGFKRIFSKDKIMELIRSILKILLIGYVVYDALKDQWDFIIQLYDYSLNHAIILIGDIVINLGLKISVLFLVVGIADYIYQKLKFKKDMRMTKQEIKDEYKQSEGDPAIKGRIRQKMREAAQRRMMQELPHADVVITNPTHLAVAIKYDKETASAPIVIAKGADFLAGKIKDIARENKIEIVENKPLARMLYYNVELGEEIPNELYQVVAEVLAYVYGLKNM